MSDEESEPSPELDALDKTFFPTTMAVDLGDQQPSFSGADERTLGEVAGPANVPLPSPSQISSPRPFSTGIFPPPNPTDPMEIRPQVGSSAYPSEAHAQEGENKEKKSGEGVKPKNPRSKPRPRKKAEPKEGAAEAGESEDGAPKKGAKRKRKSKEEKELKEGETGEEKPKRRKDRNTAHSIICQLINAAGEPGCKQRAILGYRFCIRHILNDPESPYIQCAHTRRPKTKTEPASRCTNAIKKDSNQTYCSTHLIMAGLKEVKKKAAGSPSAPRDVISPAAPLAPVEGNAAPDPKIDNKAKLSGALSPLSISNKTDSHLIKALTSPPPSTPKSVAQAHPLLRSALEMKIEPKQITQLYMAGPSGLPSEPSSPTLVIPLQVKEEPAESAPETPESPPKPYTRSQEDIKTLVSRMNPECRAVFAKFLTRKKQREAQKPDPAKLVIKKPGGGRPKRIKDDHVDRINFIWNSLDKTLRKTWVATLTCRAGIKVAKGELPFTFEELKSVNPYLASKMVECRKKVPPTRLAYGPKSKSLVVPRDGPIRFDDSDTSDEDDPELHPDHLKLKIKRQMRNMVGPYRNIAVVNEMCGKMEKMDFDQHEMFPLGFESTSEDEEDLQYEQYKGPISPLHPTSMVSIHEVKDKEMELYLKRKRLRLERHELMKKAQVNANILHAVRQYPQSVGTALLQRMERSPAPPQLLTSTLRRCCQVENKQRCERACLPSSNHCSLHVLYNVNQKLFQFCTHPQFCRRPVLGIDAMLWDGKCKLHRDSRVDKYGEYPVYSDLEEESEPSEAELSYEDEDVEEEEVEEEEVVEDEEEEDDNRSAGTP